MLVADAVTVASSTLSSFRPPSPSRTVKTTGAEKEHEVPEGRQKRGAQISLAYKSESERVGPSSSSDVAGGLTDGYIGTLIGECAVVEDVGSDEGH